MNEVDKPTDEVEKATQSGETGADDGRRPAPSTATKAEPDDQRTAPAAGDRPAAKKERSARKTPAKKAEKAPPEPPPPHPLEAPLKERFGGRIVAFEPVKGCCAAVVRAEDLLSLIAECRDELGYNYLRCISGIDRGDRLEVVYNLLNMSTKDELILKVKLDRDAPTVPSLCPLWKTANWLERETYDLFGIMFEGHPDLRRILLPDDWEGHPLRKDYVYR